MLILGLLNIVVWVWLIGYLCAIPVILRHILADEHCIKVGHIIITIICAAAWFAQLKDIVEELGDAFGFDSTLMINKIMDYELFKINK